MGATRDEVLRELRAACAAHITSVPRGADDELVAENMLTAHANQSTTSASRRSPMRCSGHSLRATRRMASWWVWVNPERSVRSAAEVATAEDGQVDDDDGDPDEDDRPGSPSLGDADARDRADRHGAECQHGLLRGDLAVGLNG